MYGVVSSGKEARVYWAKNRKGDDLAVKIYLTFTSEFKKSIRQYIEGDPRFERIRGDTRSIIYAWTRKEYRNLKRMYGAGIRVPKPYYCHKNILVMEFIGENGVRAPLLKETRLEEDEYYDILERVLNYMGLMYKKARLVHADLSEYNIMILGREVVIIDVAQSVTLDHPMADYFLRRDIKNVLRYFREEADIETPSEEEVYRRIVQ